MNRLSASAVPRALACPASLVLPQADYRTKFADAGSERHAEMEEAADAGNHDGLPDVVRELLKPGDRTATECSFAYDVATDTARELGNVGDRYASANLKPFEITGTIDLLIVGNGRVIVVDYKGFEQVTDAADNAQLATYALMVARTYGYREVTVVIVYLVANRKPSVSTLEAFDLDVHASRLRQLVVDVAAAQKNPQPVVGPQCKYCSAFLACPKQAELKQEVQQGLVALKVEAILPFADDNDAADAYELLGQIKLLTQRLSAALYARASERPIPLRSGKMFGSVTKQGNERLDGDVAYNVIRAKHGQAIADAAVERKASKTKIREALAFAAPKGKVAALERDVLEQIRERGGAKRETKTVIEEYAAQEVLRDVND